MPCHFPLLPRTLMPLRMQDRSPIIHILARTPMQWSADRNAGFSKASPHRLYLPIVIDPDSHYEAFNVEAQQNNPHSMLWWMKRLIAMRKRYKAFGRGTLEFLYPENHRVLA